MNTEPFYYFHILEIEPTNDPKIIQKAFRKLALKYHPDKLSNDGKKFQELTNAKELLLDVEFREAYLQNKGIIPNNRLINNTISRILGLGMYAFFIGTQLGIIYWFSIFPMSCFGILPKVVQIGMTTKSYIQWSLLAGSLLSPKNELKSISIGLLTGLILSPLSVCYMAIDGTRKLVGQQSVTDDWIPLENIEQEDGFVIYRET